MDYNLEPLLLSLIVFLLYAGYYFRKQIDSYIIKKKWFFLKTKPVRYLASAIILITFGYNLNNFGFYTYLYLLGFLVCAAYYFRKQINYYFVKKEWLFLKSRPARYLASISLLFTLFYYSYININSNSHEIQDTVNIIHGPKDVQIGNQIWMDKNLDVATFRNGEPIFEAKNETKWNEALMYRQPAWCYFDFKAENGRIYGKLYNEFALFDERGIAPEGYRIPDSSDILSLIQYLGGETSADRALKSKEDWIFFSYRGNNSSSFNAIPSGYLTYSYDTLIFTSEREKSVWWIRSGFFSLDKKKQAAVVEKLEGYRYNYGFSVRCIKGKYINEISNTILQNVKIGRKVWTSNNLNVNTYRNGDTIRHARTPEEWQDAASKGEGAWCYYNYHPKIGAIYGKFYNWYAVNDKRLLAPLGYHIPSDSEWSALNEYLEKSSNDVVNLISKSELVAKGNGNNKSGFNGIAGGFLSQEGKFYNIDSKGYWWSSSDSDSTSALICVLGHIDKNDSMSTKGGKNDRFMRTKGGKNNRFKSTKGGKNYGFSVRCLRD